MPTLSLAPARGQSQSTVTDDAVRRIILPGIQAGLQQIGDRSVMELMDRLSVPVEYSGGMVIRSAPGEPPRMEYDELRQSCDSNLIMVGEMPGVRISAGPRASGDSDAAIVLEYGGPGSWGHIEARPYMGPQMIETEKYAKEEIESGIRRTLPK